MSSAVLAFLCATPLGELVRLIMAIPVPSVAAVIRRTVAFLFVMHAVDLTIANHPACRAVAAVMPREKQNVCYEALSSWSTFVTAVLTAGLLIAAVWVARKQIALMDRQTDIIDSTLRATQESADAAKKSADYAAAGQRPWVIVRSTTVKAADGKERPALEGWPKPSDMFVTWPRILFLNWEMTNFGQTPAWIEYFAATFEIVPWPLPPQPPQIVQMEPFHGRLITRDRPHGHRSELLVPPLWGERLMSGEYCVVFWGTVEYRDGLEPDKPRYTHFCETWVVDQDPLAKMGRYLTFRPLGPTPDWTRHS